MGDVHLENTELFTWCGRPNFTPYTSVRFFSDVNGRRVCRECQDRMNGSPDDKPDST